jgi:intracellular septation protein
MHMLYDLVPIILFFITFKLFGIYVATQVGIAATFLQVFITRLLKKKWDRMQVITLIAFLLFGGLTLYFHNPIFVKWKPTVVFWIFSAVILFTQFFSKKPAIQRLMESSLSEGGAVVPGHIWKNLNLFWALFFALLGSINLYVAYAFSNDAWVNFKFYGISGALIVFSIFQAIYMMRYIVESKESETKE